MEKIFAKTKHMQKQKKLKFITIGLLAVIGIGAVLNIIIPYTKRPLQIIYGITFKPVEAQAPYSRQNNTFPTAKDKENLSVVDKIVIEWTKTGHKIPLEEAYDIALCESRLGQNKRNWQGSTASGVYMFINSTWDNYCDGYQMNDDDNIKCFFKLYDKHKSWWACAEIMGYL